jgi:hypothetical protein
MLHKAQVLKWLTKRILSTQTLISHKSHKPYQEVLGRAHNNFRHEYYRRWHQYPPKEGDDALFIAGYRKLVIVMLDGGLLKPRAGQVQLSYLVFMPKPCTHRMCAKDQLFHTYGQKVFTDNQIAEDSITPQEWQPGQHIA